MAKTLVQIISAAQTELGLPAQTSVIGNADPSTVQMLALLNELGEDLRDYPEEGWLSQEVEFNLIVNPPTTVTGNVTLNSPTITGILPNTTGLIAGAMVVSGPFVSTAARIKSVDSSSQLTMTMVSTGNQNGATILLSQDSYAMPSDFKYQQNRTWWDRTNRWELLGPDSPQMDQWHRSGIVATGPRRHFRVIGNSSALQYRLWPPPTEIVTPLQLVYEYQSINWVSVNGTAVGASAFANDADQPFLDDRALIKGLKWKYWQMKGFNYADMKNDWIDFVDTLVGRDGAAETLSIVKRIHPMFISPANVQDGFFPGPTTQNMSN
jgi:hypothetical protein